MNTQHPHTVEYLYHPPIYGFRLHLTDFVKNFKEFFLSCLTPLLLCCFFVLFGQQNVLADNGNVKFHPVFDPKTNMNMAHIPLPADWRIIQKTDPEQASIEGPGGIYVYDFPFKMFNYSTDPNMQLVYQQSGQQMRSPPNFQELIKDDLGPIAREEGLQYVRHYLIPELAAKDKEYNARLYRVMPVQSSFDVLVTEWKDYEGNPSLLILHYNKHLAQGTLTWGYYGSYLEAPKSLYEKAKKTLIYGLLNTRYNPEQIKAHNQLEAQKAQTSMTAHQIKMQNNQAQFEARQRAVTNSNNAVNNSIMGAWNSNNAASDRSQKRYINSIRDENTVYDSGNRQSYQVESGANQYWMNNQGEYIPSNDAQYNPNLDPYANQQNWREVEVSQ